MHDLFRFDFFVEKSFLTKSYFLIAEINLTTRGPLYTCLVVPYGLVKSHKLFWKRVDMSIGIYFFSLIYLPLLVHEYIHKGKKVAQKSKLLIL